MLSLLKTLIDLKARADPACRQCRGHGYYLREDKAMIECPCTRKGAGANTDPSVTVKPAGTELEG